MSANGDQPEKLLEFVEEEMEFLQPTVRTRREWFQFSFGWRKVRIPSGPPTPEGKIPLTETNALAFQNPISGDEEIYYFSEEGKQELLRQMTGGVFIPS